jgi:hypothetical protein
MDKISIAMYTNTIYMYILFLPCLVRPLPCHGGHVPCSTGHLPCPMIQLSCPWRLLVCSKRHLPCIYIYIYIYHVHVNGCQAHWQFYHVLGDIYHVQGTFYMSWMTVIMSWSTCNTFIISQDTLPYHGRHFPCLWGLLSCHMVHLHAHGDSYYVREIFTKSTYTVIMPGEAGTISIDTITMSCRVVTMSMDIWLHVQWQVNLYHVC